MIQSDTDEHENRVVYQLTDGKDFHIHEFDISNDGKKVVFMATPSSNMAGLYKWRFYTYSILKLRATKAECG